MKKFPQGKSMKPKVLEDHRDTQSGPCLIVGNGPSLKDFPFHFVGVIPTFACNFFPMYAPEAYIDYLVMIDKQTMVSEKLWDCIRPHTLAFCFVKWAGVLPKRKNVVWWANKKEPIDGFSFGDVWGQYFPTSAHAACWIADVMGFDDIYLVVMEGTSQARELSGVDEFGKSSIPHFYDDNPAKDSMLWDIAWGNMAHYLGQKGKSITNLSTKTAITQLMRRNHLDFFEPDTGRWKWPGSNQYPGQALVHNANLRNESVARPPSDSSGALDGLGHMELDRSPARFARKYLGTFERQDQAILQGHVQGGSV